ncbi:MAG: TetR/AcrR family transcriptional regulator [Deltaproteobacteria bacterium]|nr:TetR/AcrR family transcriptional regulator [Deltaproteobacteria bacterium]
MVVKKKKRMAGPDRARQIAEVAKGLFSKKGFRGTTTREIARQAGVSEATIFKHFRRKDDLYMAIIDRCCNDHTGQFLLKKKIHGKKDRDAFIAVALHIIERYMDDPSLGRLLMYSALEGKRFSDMFIKTRGMETLDFLSTEIKKLIKEGVFLRRDHELSARAFLGMVVHYCMAQEIYGFKRFFSRSPGTVAKTFVDIFFDGMRKGYPTQKGMTG